jgi:hypothetical protein
VERVAKRSDYHAELLAERLFKDFLMKPGNLDYENHIAVLQAMLDQIRFENPKFKLLLKQEISNRYKNQKHSEVADEIIRRLRIQNKKLIEQSASIKDQLKQTKTNRNQILSRMNDLKKRNKSFSEAIGSCDFCGGEDPDCSKCQGNGSPGWYPVNKRLFNHFVLPLLEKLYGFNVKGHGKKKK